MTRGLVVGKFRPPHRGHVHLIETALANCEDLAIFMCEIPGESPPAELRFRWIIDMFPQANVQLVPTIEPDTSSHWAAYSVSTLGFVPDVVFTSENYGETFAAALGSEHYCVDIDRKTWPISGSTLTSDPFAHWDLLTAPAKGFYTKRVAIVGPESSGKTTMAKDLARHFETTWVPEYARKYGEEKDLSPEEWDKDEHLFDEIRVHQPQWEEAGALAANRVLFCDTDLLTTSVWHELYRGYRDEALHEESLAHEYDLYILLGSNVPWVADGSRNVGDVEKRLWLFERIGDEVIHRGQRLAYILSSHFDDRFRSAVREVQMMLRDEGIYRVGPGGEHLWGRD